ncbi:MAG: dihydrolipoamide acetyltransferase family protein [Chloroflexota bacterium]
MAKPVFIPKFGFTLEESEIVQWLVEEGTTVQAGDPVAEVTTDKVNMEVEAPADGILAGICAQVGDMVAVTATIAWIVAPGEELPPEATNLPSVEQSEASSAAQAQPVAPPPLSTGNNGSKAVQSSPVASRMAQAHDVDLNQVTGSGRGGRIERRDVEALLAGQDGLGKVRATPAARRLAREAAIDLVSLTGSGPLGRVQAVDVEQAQAAMEQPPATSQQPATTMSDINTTRIPFTNMRRTIARRLQQSMQEAPHIFFEASASVAELQALCDTANQHRMDDDPKVNLTAGITRAVAWTLRRHPLLNSHIGDNESILFEDIHIGMAVALENGLVVPVLRHVDRKGLREISIEIRSLAEKARSGKLSQADMSGGTFSISNLGMYGVDRFTAIINPPEVGILAVGAIKKSLVLDENDEPVVQPMMTITLSVDHRVIDGAVAAQFLADLKKAIEHPSMMLVF